jgi:hypothetical protein
MGWWVDDIRLYTCSGQAGVLSRGFVPVAGRAAGASGAWQTVVQEGFEGAWPPAGGLWSVSEPGYEEYFWARRTCQAATGSYSAWAMGGGSLGQGLGCGASYVSFANAWMVYGPSNLAGATAAEFNLSLWLDAEADYDFVYVMASTDGNQFRGTRFTGSTAGAFVPVSLNLQAVPELGDVTDDPQVWVAVLFWSDSSVVQPEGAHVDDLIIRKCAFGACPASQVLPAAAGLRSGPARWQLSNQQP